MNILIIGENEFHPRTGGTESVSLLLGDEFRRAGHNVWFVACRRSGYVVEGSDIHEQSMLPGGAENSEGNLEALSRFVREHEVQIIMNQFCHLPWLTDLCIDVRQRTEAKLVSTLHINPDYAIMRLLNLPRKGNSAIERVGRDLLRRLQRPSALRRACRRFSAIYKRVYENSDRTVLLSENYRRTFCRMIAADEHNLDRLVAILNPTPIASQRLDMSEKENIVLFVGRMDIAHKRPDRMLRIWSEIEKRHPSWELVLLGDGQAMGQMKRLKGRLKLKRATFTGFVPPEEYYRRASVICMTSSYEGLPMTLIEAIRFGVTPVAFDSFESLSDIVDDGTDGFRVAPFDMKAYVGRLSQLLDDGELRGRMAVNAIRKSDRFAPEVIIPQWLEMFDKILKEA
ncbi:MAG: glycosyltransferase [Rikenellaceae bacterium]|jgi:glycosyltransferase involved in cell wall biosynthesis|nr:glycosyltransferase [Rikenellaceae bacterium]